MIDLEEYKTIAVGLICWLCLFLPANAQQDSIIKKIETYYSMDTTSHYRTIKECYDTIWVKVEWIGNITAGSEYNGIDSGFYGDNPPASIWMRKDIIIGLREDGILVWKRKDKNNYK